jgi:hypothetical protein
MLGTDSINGRAAYVIAISPKTQNKYLLRGKVWVDADEYAIVRIEGVPAKSANDCGEEPKRSSSGGLTSPTSRRTSENWGRDWL